MITVLPDSSLGNNKEKFCVNYLNPKKWKVFAVNLDNPIEQSKIYTLFRKDVLDIKSKRIIEIKKQIIKELTELK